MVQYKGTTYHMKIAISASGSKYVAPEFIWWTKGSGPGSSGTLFSRMANGTSGEVIERCSGA
jgi:membrane-bound inhibitor of C-type lysozyme